MRILPDDPLRASRESVIEEAVSVIESGGVIIFPTDTVYGIGCDSQNAEGIARLFEIKRRDRDKPIPLLISSVDQVMRMAADSLTDAFWRLSRAFWPGGLTLVVRTKRGSLPEILTAGRDTAGFRMPDHELIHRIIDRLGRPIAATSANLSGETEGLSLYSIPDQVLNAVDLAIDGGRSEGGTPSTVVDVTVSPPAILRLGAIAESEIMTAAAVPDDESQEKYTVLFVCTGNICRSPMAEWLLRDELQRRGCTEKIEVMSAGTFSLFGNEPTNNAQEVMREIGIDISGHRSRQVSRSLLRRSDLVLVMARHHLSSVKRLLPENKDNVHLLAAYATGELRDVSDPYGRSIEEYRRCRDEIKGYVSLILDRVLTGKCGGSHEME